MLKDCWDIFIAFLRAANLGFGGGPATIPLIQAEVVVRYKWMTQEEFTDALAIGNALPGPIATKMAAYIGYKVAGWLGALSALLATIVPTAAVVILMSQIILKYSSSPELKGMLTGVRPVVVVLIAKTAIDMGEKAFINIKTWGVAIFAILLLFLNIHPAIIIVLSMIYGYFFLDTNPKIERKS